MGLSPEIGVVWSPLQYVNILNCKKVKLTSVWRLNTEHVEEHVTQSKKLKNMGLELYTYGPGMTKLRMKTGNRRKLCCVE